MSGPAGLLVTGCYRSGTTVLEKLLHAHPRLIVASQPYPVLYFFAKGLFLAERGLERRYPLDHLFLEDGYAPRDLHDFLDRTVLGPERIADFFDRMERYEEGLWTPEMLRFRERIRPGTFLEVCRQLDACIAELFPKPEPRLVGGKEVLVEEYVPYLLARGRSVILSVRDPRAMIASLDFRDRDNLTGADRPVLYSLRAWRKSVAFALGCEGEPGFAWLRYEDLVSDPTGRLAGLTARLGLEPHPPSALEGGIRDQRGEPWEGNSSFAAQAGVSSGPLSAWRRKLPEEMVAYVETVCLPEMRALGYGTEVVRDFDAGVLERYRDPFASIHQRFPADYSAAPHRVAHEKERYALLQDAQGDLPEAEARRWFVHPRASRRLRAALAAG